MKREICTKSQTQHAEDTDKQRLLFGRGRGASLSTATEIPHRKPPTSDTRPKKQE